MDKRNTPGLNIQWPWSRLILDGHKTVETRSYKLPVKYENVPLALIETPGPLGRRNGIESARVIGYVTFSTSFKYENRNQWARDLSRHRVSINDADFSWRAGNEKC